MKRTANGYRRSSAPGGIRTLTEIRKSEGSPKGIHRQQATVKRLSLNSFEFARAQKELERMKMRQLVEQVIERRTK